MKSSMGGQASSTYRALNTSEAKFIEDLTKKHCVVVFSKTYCSYCKKVKKIFQENNIIYEAVELNEREDGEILQGTLLQLTGARSVPRVFINGKCIGGASDTEKLHKQNKLLKIINECSQTQQ